MFAVCRDFHEKTDSTHRPLTCPGSIELKDMRGDMHRLLVKVLGTEETWNTPSLILATDANSDGVAVFSQVICYSVTSTDNFEILTGVNQYISGSFGS